MPSRRRTIGRLDNLFSSLAIIRPLSKVLKGMVTDESVMHVLDLRLTLEAYDESRVEVKA